MDLQWNSIRALDGSQQTGFEELCAQLARTETPEGAKFVRKGRPDAGVECYCTLEDGSEWGWQAKYFTAALGDSQWAQVDKSVKKALEKHPGLVRYYVCAPRDRSDHPREGITTEMQRWERHVDKWEGWAGDRGMDTEFVWWGSSELLERLSTEQHAGRVDFWFGNARRFSPDWFESRLGDALEAAGPRFTPELHIDLPIAEKLEMFGRTEPALDSIRRLTREVRREFRSIRPSREARDKVNGEFGLDELGQAGQRIEEALLQLDMVPDRTLELPAVVEEIDGAISLADGSQDALTELERSASPEAQEAGGYRPNPHRDWRGRLQNLQHRLRDVRAAVVRADEIANSRLMIVTGQAGTGKTHLLCDVVKGRIAAGLPTVMLMGQHFTTTDGPWDQGLRQLDAHELSAERFVGALEAAAQAADTRALLVIDALNEGEGYSMWPAHLAAFLNRLNSPWIGVLLSVRTTYDAAIVPRAIRETGVEIEHDGFADVAYDATQAYFAHYDIELPSTPILHPEFNNPLFLKVLCEGLQRSGVNRLPRGFQGITQVFGRYLDGFNSEIAHSLDFNPSDNVVRRALEGIAAVLAEQETRAIPRSAAEEIANPLVSGSGFSRSLYRALVTSGLLIESPNYPNPERGEVVSIAFERLADHLIADHLLRAHLDPDDPAAAFGDGGNLAFLSGTEGYVRAGLIEAMCIQVPERTAAELPRLLPEMRDSYQGRSAFLASLVWRDIDGFSAETEAVFQEFLRPPHRVEPEEVFDILLTIATIPDHPFNAHYLDRLLRRYEMPARDALWSTYLHYAYEQRGPVDRLLDWATALQPSDSADLEDNVVELATVALAWMLSTPNRFVRDRATKGLVGLLTGRLDATAEVVRQFRKIDDPYISERIYAVAYGVAMRCNKSEVVHPLATLVYESVFASGKPPPHILLRDYARGVVERAIHLGVSAEFKADLFRPPYASNWPQIPEQDELLSLTPHLDDDTLTRWDPELARNRIRHSVIGDDFATYVVGTHSGRSNWLSLSRGSETWRSPDERMEALEADMSADARLALAELAEARRQVPLWFSFIDSSRRTVNEGSEQDHEDALARVAAAQDKLIVLLTPSQRVEYESIEQARASDAPHLDLDLIQRYVLNRVFDLGWTVERFGTFDRTVGRFHTRQGDKPERVGKKYQWIAYHEILGYVSDHFQYYSRFSDDPDPHRYRGPWQLSCRDMDPSVTLPRQGAISTRGDGLSWWEGSTFNAWDQHLVNHEWLSQDGTFPDPTDFLRVHNSDDGSCWINVRALNSWRQPVPPELDTFEASSRQVWLHATAYFVEADKADDSAAWAQQVNLWPGPPPGTLGNVFLGEHGWGPAFREIDAEAHLASSGADMDCPPGVRLAAFEYPARAGEYDCSFQDSLELQVPNPSFVDSMGLQWTGNAADFVDSTGQLAAFDPTAHGDGPVALLLREDLVAQYLEREGLALIWAVIGEKMAVSDDRAHEWGGSLRATGTYRYTRSGLVGGMSYKLDLPAPHAD